MKKAYTMVRDYGPGIDAEGAFQRAFKAAGGEIVGSVRMPVANPDFSAFVQRPKAPSPESIFVFVPGGPHPGVGTGHQQGVATAEAEADHPDAVGSHRCQILQVTTSSLQIIEAAAMSVTQYALHHDPHDANDAVAPREHIYR